MSTHPRSSWAFVSLCVALWLVTVLACAIAAARSAMLGQTADASEWSARAITWIAAGAAFHHVLREVRQ